VVASPAAVSTNLSLGEEGNSSEEVESVDQELNVEARPTLEEADDFSCRSLSSPVPPDASSEAARGFENEACSPSARSICTRATALLPIAKSPHLFLLLR